MTDDDQLQVMVSAVFVFVFYFYFFYTTTKLGSGTVGDGQQLRTNFGWVYRLGDGQRKKPCMEITQGTSMPTE